MINACLLDLLPNTNGTSNDSKTSRRMQAQRQVHIATRSSQCPTYQYATPQALTPCTQPSLPTSYVHTCAVTAIERHRTRIVTTTAERFDTSFINRTALVALKLLHTKLKHTWLPPEDLASDSLKRLLSSSFTKHGTYAAFTDRLPCTRDVATPTAHHQRHWYIPVAHSLEP